MKFSTPALGLSVVLALSGVVAALPAADFQARDEHPTIIPGPGLPSLEELGLTAADLYKRNPNFKVIDRRE